MSSRGMKYKKDMDVINVGRSLQRAARIVEAALGREAWHCKRVNIDVSTKAAILEISKDLRKIGAKLVAAPLVRREKREAPGEVK